MTHWLVKVYNIYASLKPIGEAIKQYYSVDKRGFTEALVSWILNVIFVMAMLEWVVFPIPVIPRQTAILSPFQMFFVVMKPYWLHMLALIGCLLLLNPRLPLFR